MGMISTIYMAKKLGLQVKNGFAFGQFNGYDILIKSTFWNDVKLFISFHADNMYLLEKAIHEFRIWNESQYYLFPTIVWDCITKSHGGMYVEFFRQSGVYNCIKFVKTVTPLLRHYRIKGHGFCSACGRELDEAESFTFDEEGFPNPFCHDCKPLFMEDSDMDEPSDNRSELLQFNSYDKDTHVTEEIEPFFEKFDDSKFDINRFIPGLKWFVLEIIVFISIMALLASPVGDSIFDRFSEKPEPYIGFTDITEDSPYRESVYYVDKMNIMHGVSKSKFNPNGSVTHENIQTILCQYGHIGKNKISSGMGNITPEPTSAITREQLAVYFANYLKEKEIKIPSTAAIEHSYNDLENVSDWAVEPVSIMQQTGIITVTDGKSFDPAETVTRAETAAAIEKLIHLIQSQAPVTIDSEIVFGSFEQDNIVENGKEDLEWIVLDIIDHQALLITKYALNADDYSETRSKTSWENSKIRDYLNHEFFKEAFSENQQMRILKMMIPNTPNPDFELEKTADTRDKIFLLNVEEARKYFTSDENRICYQTELTHNLPFHNFQAKNLRSCWWLRTNGSATDKMTYVNFNGKIIIRGIAVSRVLDVRPAMWISIN